MLSRFRRAQEGTIAITFAIMLVPLVAATALAVDISRAYVVRSRLAAALDAAGLAYGSSSGTTAELKTRMVAFLNANYPESALGNDVAVADPVVVGEKISLSASASVNTTFGKIFGLFSPVPVDSIEVSVSNEVIRKIAGLEIALVLDNTGSMVGTKMTNLKSAAISLVDKMAAAAARSSEPDAVRLALVPYTMTVNVGNKYASAAWIDTEGKSPINNQIFTGSTAVKRLNLFSSMSTTWAGCVEARPSPYDVTESPPTTATPGTLYVPYFAPDEPDTSSAGYVNNYLADGTSSTTWQTRQGNPSKYTVKPRTGTTSLGYQYGPNSGCQIQPLTRLTSNFSSFKTAINAMTAGGDTNISAGLMWGWHVLSPNAPFSDGVPYGDKKYTKVIVLMSDGQNHNVVVNNNNQSAYSGIGYIWQNRIGLTSGSLSERIKKLDQKLAQACINAKSAGILIYTVVLKDAAVDQSTVRNCASSSDKAFYVSDASQLGAAFDAIAGSIQNLRLSK